MDKEKIVFKGSHPDSLYRVSPNCGTPVGKITRVFRLLRWPAALISVCIAIAVLVYFLMPYNIDTNSANSTYWEPAQASASQHVTDPKLSHSKTTENMRQEERKKGTKSTVNHGTNTPEINFSEARKISDTSPTPQKNLPAPPIFPEHISPVVQYGNEKADTDKLRTPKVFTEIVDVPYDSTLKPHITQKPEKPLAVYFDENSSSSSTEMIEEKNNNSTNYDKPVTIKNEPVHVPAQTAQEPKVLPIPYQEPDRATEIKIKPITLDAQEYIQTPIKQEMKFTSGHSKLFGISIEDAERMKSTTQSSLYNTRVSPTLPTWRDGDDTTTKNYPTNAYLEVQCRSTHMPICRGILPYDLARAPAKIDGVDITSLMSQIERLVASNCSERVQHYFCALLEPECSAPSYPSKLPCKNFCKVMSESCAGYIPHELVPVFNCDQYDLDNCIDARTPCFPDEFTCGDGSCIPKDLACDGNDDCPTGDDEAICVQCARNEFRCRSGTCIPTKWVCDGYSDCPNGEDELHSYCVQLRKKPLRQALEPEFALASAPAPAYRRPQRPASRRQYSPVNGDAGQELLVASDTKNALKRNFTRRPSPSRLSQYSREKFFNTTDKQRPSRAGIIRADRREHPIKKTSFKMAPSFQEFNESLEDVMKNLEFFDEIDGQNHANRGVRPIEKTQSKSTRPNPSTIPSFVTGVNNETKNDHDRPMTKIERVIDGSKLMQKVAEGVQETEAMEKARIGLRDGTSTSRIDDQASAHSSPCPPGELRCVDGRCITLAHLCDGAVDCSDHADEDNCYA